MTVLSHVGQPPAPHDLWFRWHADPLVLIGLMVIVALYSSGVRHTDSRQRRRAFAAAITMAVIALLSPLDAAAEALASAHMIQHLVLTSVVAPLLVVARPGPAIRRAVPTAVARPLHRFERRIGLGRRTSLLRHPGVALIGATITFWFWHGSGPYVAALRSTTVHGVSHLSYLGAGVLIWSIVATAGHPGRVERPMAMGLLFALGLQGTLLAALMTFADRPWYEPYVMTTPAWGLDPLTDQQLAALLMWFPSASAYLLAALWLLWGWLVAGERSAELFAVTPGYARGHANIEQLGKTTTRDR